MFGARRDSPGAGADLVERPERRMDPLPLLRAQLLEPVGEPGGALDAHGLENLFAVACDVQPDPATVGGPFAPDQLLPLEPGEVARDPWSRETLPFGELLRRHAGVELDRYEQRDLTAGDAAGVGLTPEVAGQPQQNRTQLVCQRQRIVNHLNHRRPR